MFRSNREPVDPQRRLVLGAAAGTALLSGTGRAQTGYPNRPVKLIIPYPAGGVVDLVGRSISDKMSAALGQPFVVEARPGANGNIGAEAVKNSPADGYTLMMGAPFLIINPLLDANSKFAARDFTPIALVASPPNLYVVPATLPVNSVKELEAYIKARPKQLNTVNHGTGSSNHMGTEVFLANAGLEMNMVGYKGQPASIPDMANGQLHFMLLTAGLALPHLKSGKLKALAVGSNKRVKALPDVPTLAEAGYPDLVVLPWYGIVAPAGTPRAICERLNTEINAALKAPDVVQRLDTMNAEIFGGSIDEFDALMKKEQARWPQVIRDRRIKPDAG